VRRLISIAAALVVSGGVAAPSAQAEPGAVDVHLVPWVRTDMGTVDVAGAFNCFHGENIGYWTADLAVQTVGSTAPDVKTLSGTCEDSGLMTLYARFPYDPNGGCIWEPPTEIASIRADVTIRWWADGLAWQTDTGSVTIDAPPVSTSCWWW
jgi:hypothetical protein